jgi:hypothetical protein
MPKKVSAVNPILVTVVCTNVKAKVNLEPPQKKNLFEVPGFHLRG